LPTLFSPLTLKNVIAKNRIAMPPMAHELATTDGLVTPQMIEHYALRASYGVGLIIMEHSYVCADGKYSPKQNAIDRDEVMKGLKTLVEEVHKFGVPIGIQLSHAGGNAREEIIGQVPVAPSALKTPRGKDVARELTIKEIEELIEAFAKAAERAKKAGFDFVEIHAAHGYLLNQFWSPLTNKRQDRYGGSRKNRLRFLLEVIEAVRGVLGSDFLLFLRLGADDRLPGGLTLEDSIFALPYLEAAGADLIDLSGGHCGYLKEGPEGFFLYMAEALRPHTLLPLMVTGGIKTPQAANEIIVSGKSDLVGIGRVLLKEPSWPLKAREVLGKELNDI